MLARLETGALTAGLSPVDVVRTVQSVVGVGKARAAVDAGAHMFSTMAFWDAEQPNGLMISNGLASMGYALPSAIAAALHEPGRPVIAFTGDGGLMMCAGELATAANLGVKLIVVVFNDSGLSLTAGQSALGRRRFRRGREGLRRARHQGIDARSAGVRHGRCARLRRTESDRCRRRSVGL